MVLGSVVNLGVIHEKATEFLFAVRSLIFLVRQEFSQPEPLITSDPDLLLLSLLLIGPLHDALSFLPLTILLLLLLHDSFHIVH